MNPYRQPQSPPDSREARPWINWSSHSYKLSFLFDWLVGPLSKTSQHHWSTSSFNKQELPLEILCSKSIQLAGVGGAGWGMAGGMYIQDMWPVQAEPCSKKGLMLGLMLCCYHLKFLIVFEQGPPHTHIAWGPGNYIARYTHTHTHTI